MIRNKTAYWNTVNRNAPAIRRTLRDRAGALVYLERARRFYQQAMERGDKRTADMHAAVVREYENILATLDTAEGGGI